jgi:chitinase
MASRRTLSAFGIALLMVSGMTGSATALYDPPKVVVGYYASWDVYGRAYYPKDIPADGVTHLNYAFAAATADGNCGLLDTWADFQKPFEAGQSVDGVADDASETSTQHLFGNFNQLRKLKADHPGLKILISIGGWSDSTYFSDVAVSKAAREKFVTSCIDMFIKGDLPTGGWPTTAGGPGAGAGVFDGIDVDWEYPVCCGLPDNSYRPEDRRNATRLFREFRKQLDALGDVTGKHYPLTAAIPAGNQQPATSYNLPVVAGILDWINVMTYDFHGSWETTTNFDSPFSYEPGDPTGPGPYQNTVGTLEWFRSQGVPASKLVMGIPFYAKQYIRVTDTDYGLYQPYDNTGLSEDTLTFELTPSPSYHDLVDVAHVLVPRSGGVQAHGAGGFTRYWSAAAGEPWLYDPAAERVGITTPTFISYEDPASVHERVRYIQRNHLRGAMFWEISHDSDDHALVNALHRVLQP